MNHPNHLVPSTPSTKTPVVLLVVILWSVVAPVTILEPLRKLRPEVTIVLRRWLFVWLVMLRLILAGLAVWFVVLRLLVASRLVGLWRHFATMWFCVFRLSIALTRLMRARLLMSRFSFVWLPRVRMTRRLPRLLMSRSIWLGMRRRTRVVS